MPGAKRRRSGRLPTICNGFVFVHFLHFFVLEGSAFNGPNLKGSCVLTPNLREVPRLRVGCQRFAVVSCVCVSYHFFVVFGRLSFLQGLV